MKIVERIFYENSWKNSLSKKFFIRKSLINNNKYIYPNCITQDLNKVVESAKKGFKKNKILSFKERSDLLYKVYKNILKDTSKIASLETSETGKKYNQALDEIKHSAKIWLYASRIAKSLNIKTYLDKYHKGHINYEPVGVVSLIVPWNFPFIVTSERLPFILAAGNSIIIKPSEYASKSISYLMKIIKKTGYPKGVVNLLYGSGNEIGKKLTSHNDINMISFTGSTEVGKKIMSACSKTIKRVSLELGGKNSIIILSDSDLNKVINIIIKGFTLNSGQCCVATSKLLVHESIKEELIKNLISRLKSIKSFSKEYGPISTTKQYKKIKRLLNLNKKYHKKIVFGKLKFNKNNFIEPVIYKDLPENNILLKSEIFGPILTINSFKNDKQAIDLANSTEYGLSAVICGKDKRRNMKIANEIKSGRIWINQSIAKNFPSLPIGGFKQSGLNRECGLEGIKTYSEIKSIIIKN